MKKSSILIILLVILSLGICGCSKDDSSQIKALSLLAKPAWRMLGRCLILCGIEVESLLLTFPDQLMVVILHYRKEQIKMPIHIPIEKLSAEAWLVPLRFASGIIPLTLRTSRSSFLASVIKNLCTEKEYREPC